MKSPSRDATRRASVASAIMLLSPLCFPGAQASDLTVINHSSAILNMYNNDGCIHNIGCHERPIGHFIVSNILEDIGNTIIGNQSKTFV